MKQSRFGDQDILWVCVSSRCPIDSARICSSIELSIWKCSNIYVCVCVGGLVSIEVLLLCNFESAHPPSTYPSSIIHPSIYQSINRPIHSINQPTHPLISRGVNSLNTRHTHLPPFPSSLFPLPSNIPAPEYSPLDQNPLTPSLDELIQHESHVRQREPTHVEPKELRRVSRAEFQPHVRRTRVFQSWVLRLARDLIYGCSIVVVSFGGFSCSERMGVIETLASWGVLDTETRRGEAVRRTTH